MGLAVKEDETGPAAEAEATTSEAVAAEPTSGQGGTSPSWAPGAPDPSHAPKHLAERSWPWRPVLLALAIAAVLAVLGSLIVAVAAASQTGQAQDQLLPGTVIAGVDVGGLTPERARAAVDEGLAAQLDEPVTLHWADREWEQTPRELGASSDADEAIADAMAQSRDIDWLDHVRIRWLGWGGGSTYDVTVSHSADEAGGVLADIAGDIDRAPRDTHIDTSSGWVDGVTPHRIGYELDQDASASAIVDALESGEDEVELVVERHQPQTYEGSLDQILLLRQNERRLYLYEGDEIVADWAVAVGTGGHPTPQGIFHVELKRHMPTWVNPDPDGWGSGMPERIEPGVDNPLGVRALNWSGGQAIRFHGTSNEGSIGTAASKGCVRLTNNDVVQLYDRVDEGATIVSISG